MLYSVQDSNSKIIGHNLAMKPTVYGLLRCSQNERNLQISLERNNTADAMGTIAASIGRESPERRYF